MPLKPPVSQSYSQMPFSYVLYYSLSAKFLSDAVTNLQSLQELRERVEAMEALGTPQNPAASCHQIAEQNPTSLPGNFWIHA